MSFWTKCLNRFHFFALTARQTQVSFVSIDRRGSTSTRSVPDIQHIVGGLHTPKNAILRRMPLAPHIAIQMWPSERHFRSLGSAQLLYALYHILGAVQSVVRSQRNGYTASLAFQV